MTRETLDQVERAVWIRLGQIQMHAKILAENPGLIQSNADFFKMSDYKTYLSETDKQWQAQDPNVPGSIIYDVLDKALCERLAANVKQSFFYTQRFGYDIFKQVTVTNRFGAVIGQTSHNKKYNLSHQDWWIHAKEKGAYVGPIDLRTKTMSVAAPILDISNNFVGVIQCSLNVQEFKDILNHSAENSAYASTCFTLLSKSNLVLHATHNKHWAYVTVAMNAKPNTTVVDQNDVWFLVKNPQDRKKPKAMITRARSKGYRNYEGQHWTLCMSVSAAEALYPVHALKMALLIPFSVLCVATIAAALMFSYSVLRPIEKLSDTANAIKNGDLTAKADIHSHDEIGHLAESFDQMTEELEGNIDSLNKEIEERKKAEEGMAKVTGNLVESVQELEKANREIRQITYVAAHDLKTPLRGMSMVSQWLLEDHGHVLDPDAQEQIKQLSERADRFDKLLDGLREYSSLPSDDDKIRTFHLTQYLNDMVNADYKEFEPYIMIPENLPEITSPTMAIKTVFHKIINNAIRHMDKNAPAIQIRCHAHLHGWTFYVSDNGPGIDEKYHKKIFGLFQRLSQEDTATTTGMGLCIAKKIVEAYGGRIWVDSELNAGSTFAFSWPKSPRTVSVLERLTMPVHLS